MDDIETKLVGSLEHPRAPKISAQEMTLRLSAVQQAQANNRIEGISSGAETKPIFDAFVRGEIEAREIVPRLKMLYKLP